MLKKKYAKVYIVDELFDACKDLFNDPYHIDPYRMCIKQAVKLQEKFVIRKRRTNDKNPS